jgi:hypothetical protein
VMLWVLYGDAVITGYVFLAWNGFRYKEVIRK